MTPAPVGLSGYATVPSPTSMPGDEGPLSNASSSILPVFAPSLLGNAYGGGFVRIPSVYVTKLLLSNGPSEGVPPGYGFTSQMETLAGASFDLQPSQTSIENSTLLFPSLAIPSSTPFTVFTGLGLPSSTAFNVGGITYEVSLPAATASFLSSVVPIVNASSVSVTTYTSQLEVPGSSSSASVVIVEGSGFGFAVIGSEGSSSNITGSEASNAMTTSPTAAIGSQGQGLLPTILSDMPISMSANGAPIFASSSVAGAAIIAASQVTGAPNPQIAPTASTHAVGVSKSSEVFSNVPVALITHTATSGEVIVETSSPPPVFISSGASDFELIVTTSTPSPVLVSETASNGQAFVATSTPPGISISFASATATSLVVGSPFALGVVGSPTSPNQTGGAPITLAAASPTQGQALASSHSTATVLTPFVGLNDLTSLAVIATSATQSISNQPIATFLTPVVGVNGLTSFAFVPISVEQTASANQPAATVSPPVAGFNGLTSLAVIPTPAIGANGLTSLAVFSTSVVATNGLVSPAVILTPVVGANGVTSLAVLATPVIGANGLTSLAVGLQDQQGPTIPAPMTPTPNYGPGPVLSSLFPSIYSIPSSPSGSNSSVHVPLNPSAVMPFEGSAFRHSISLEIGLVNFIVFLSVLLFL